MRVAGSPVSSSSTRAGGGARCAPATSWWRPARSRPPGSCSPAAARAHPAGIGNAHDQVGRNLQGHLYTGAFGLFDEPVQDGSGPGPAIATCAFVHGNAGVIGGGMLANEFVKLPMMFWLTAQAPGTPGWGVAAKHAMRDAYRRTGQVFGPVQEIPMAALAGDARRRASSTTSVARSRGSPARNTPRRCARPR